MPSSTLVRLSVGVCLSKNFFVASSPRGLGFFFLRGLIVRSSVNFKCRRNISIQRRASIRLGTRHRLCVFMRLHYTRRKKHRDYKIPVARFPVITVIQDNDTRGLAHGMSFSTARAGNYSFRRKQNGTHVRGLITRYTNNWSSRFYTEHAERRLRRSSGKRSTGISSRCIRSDVKEKRREFGIRLFSARRARKMSFSSRILCGVRFPHRTPLRAAHGQQSAAPSRGWNFRERSREYRPYGPL